MTRLPFRKVLALSPHTDDIEFGCGGTIARLLDEEAEIHTAVFSLCEESVPEEYPEDVLLHEVHAAADVMGIPGENRHIYQYPVRRFPSYRQEILEDMVQLKQRIQPDLVLIPSTYDVHQDHETVTEEALRAFRFGTLLGYELPWNNLSFTNQVVIELQQSHLDLKIKALTCYESQSFRPYADPELFTANAVVRGIQNKKVLAEAFEVIKLFL